MWRLVREGLRFYRPTLLSAWTTGAFGPAAVYVVLAWIGVKIAGWHALAWAAAALPVYLLGASAVAAWITIGTELSEHRLRLHAQLPMPLASLARARLALPSAMVLLGLPLAHAVSALARAIDGGPAPWLGHAALNLIGAHFLLLLQLTLAAKEVTVLRDTVRWRPWYEGPAAARRNPGSRSRPGPAGEPAAGVTPARVPAGEKSHEIRAGAVLAPLGWCVLVVLLGAEVVLGVPNATLLIPGIVRIHVPHESLNLCTAAVVALSLLTSAFTIALFRRRTEITR